MDGFHDLGGKQGFAPVTKAGKTDPFHDDWEVRIGGISGALVGRHFYNMDEFRHAIERMDPRHYMSASYFERTFTSVVSLCVEKGLFTREELNAAAGEAVPLARPRKPGRGNTSPLPDFKVGDRVRVKNEFVAGHIRMPGYVRGKIGTIVGISPAYPFPDAAAHGLISDEQKTFDVCFQSAELWPEGSETAEVHVGIFHSYLERT